LTLVASKKYLLLRPKKNIFSLLLCLISLFTYSQQVPQNSASQSGKIKGTVIEASTKQPFEYATVVLYRQKDSSLVTGAVAGSKGEFVITSVPPGNFYIKASFMGYNPYMYGPVIISAENSIVDLGIIKLTGSTQQMKEVEVTSTQSQVQVAIDKKVFDVDKNIVSKGGSANDVLQTIPSVSVDIDGNISMRGSGEIQVFIDGKPSAITGASRAAILEQIPASSIQSVELITNPSAKYSAEGMTGIINIITKKNKVQGFNGSATVGAGTHDKYNASTTLSYRKNKWNFYSTYGFRSTNKYGYGHSYQRNTFPDTIFSLTQDFNSLNKNISHNINAGVDYYLNPNNTLSLTGIYNNSSDDTHQTTNFYKADNNNVLSSAFMRDANVDAKPQYSNNYDLIYKRTYKKPKEELTADLTYSNALKKTNEQYNDSDYSLLEEYKNATPFRQTVATSAKTRLNALQVDYSNPLKHDIKLDLGGRVSLREIDNSYRSQLFNYTTNVFYTDPALSNDFNYTENIYAAYTTIAQSIKKFGYQAGLRAEETNTISDLVTSNQKYHYDYFKVFPSAHLTQKIKETNELQLSYSKRINRPNINALNPFKNYSDPYNIQMGNPFLKPELVNSIELSYLKYFKKAVLTGSAYYRKSKDVIQRYKYITDTSSSVITFLNLNSSQTYGIELILKTDLAKWWNMTLSMNGFKTKLNASNISGDLQNSNTSYLIKLMSNMHVWKNMDIQAVGNFNGPTVTAQGHIKSITAIDIGIKKEIFKNADLSLNVSDITNARVFWLIANNDPTFYLDTKRKRESRILTVNFTYRFGKLTESKKGRPDKQNTPAPDGEMGM
jgi:outer membrane receptor protein involved in Fe transport